MVYFPSIWIRSPAAIVTLHPPFRPVFRSRLPIFVLLLGLSLAAAQPASSDERDGWQVFERRVRDGTILSQEALQEISHWSEALAKAYPPGSSAAAVFFPLRGGSAADIGGNNGNGYRPEGFDFLDGNRHRGHPAQDIFIRDRDRDGRDDRTGRPVDVIVFADGVVLSTFTGWSPEDSSRAIRGGNYVWIYHPAGALFSYYAHLAEIFVTAGQRVEGGSALAALGRSGANACLARSPTHLHFMLLQAKDMRPITPFPFLLK
jgi:murein DD-endopeptidase MepM/ murein hydrolase activator NlpD